MKETDEPTDMNRMLPHTEVTLPGVAGVGVGMLARGPPVFYCPHKPLWIEPRFALSLHIASGFARGSVSTGVNNKRMRPTHHCLRVQKTCATCVCMCMCIDTFKSPHKGKVKLASDNLAMTN